MEPNKSEKTQQTHPDQTGMSPEEKRGPSRVRDRKDMEKIFKGHGFRTIGQSDNQLLFEAAKYGDVDIIEFIINTTSSSLDIKNSIGETLAHIAAKNNKTSVLKFLFLEGIKINSKNGLQETPLMIAAEEGSLDVVNYFLKKKDVDVKDLNEFGETCLHYAAREGRGEVCDVLIQKNLDLILIENKQGRNALSYAFENNHKEAIRVLDQAEKEYNLKLNQQQEQQSESKENLMSKSSSKQ